MAKSYNPPVLTPEVDRTSPMVSQTVHEQPISVPSPHIKEPSLMPSGGMQHTPVLPDSPRMGGGLTTGGVGKL